MFYEQRLSAPETPTALQTEYAEELAAILEGIDLETAAAETGIDRDRLEALLEDESPDLELEEVAEIQALADGEPDAETIVEMACDNLLLGMTTAVLDVEAVAADLDLDLDPKEVQQKIERRAPMSFEEFVHIQHVIASATP